MPFRGSQVQIHPSNPKCIPPKVPMNKVSCLCRSAFFCADGQTNRQSMVIDGQCVYQDQLQCSKEHQESGSEALWKPLGAPASSSRRSFSCLSAKLSVSEGVHSSKLDAEQGRRAWGPSHCSHREHQYQRPCQDGKVQCLYKAETPGSSGRLGCSRLLDNCSLLKVRHHLQGLSASMSAVSSNMIKHRTGSV